MTLGDRLRTMRIERRESLFQVAQAIGSSKAHIWDLERNRSRNPSLDLLRKLAAHFETTVAGLIDESEGDSSAADRFLERNRHRLAGLSRTDLQLLDRLIDRLSNVHPILIAER